MAMRRECLLRDGGKKMLLFCNAEGKEWLIPLDGMRSGLLLYQPSGWKGHLIKRVLPVVGRWEWGRRMAHTRMTEKSLQKDIRDAIEDAFGTKDFDYSIFFGTPCPDQKVTIQVSHGNRILGYCKVSDSEETGRKFGYEMDLLNELRQKGMTGIPRGLSCTTTANGLYFYAQSTEKNLHSAYPHSWGKLHEQFIRSLHDHTRATLPYEATDFHHIIVSLRKRLEWLDADTQQTLGECIEKIEHHFDGKPAEWSVYHGDFTPWNTFVSDGRLFVFDWEYALRTCPPLLDRYHWFTQVCIFEKHYRSEKICKEFVKEFGISDIFSYLCYLIVNISIYIGREKGPDDVKNITMLATWTHLIKRMLRQ